VTFPSPDPVFAISQTALTCLTNAITTVAALATAAGPSYAWRAPQSTCYRVSTQIPFDMDKYQDMCCEGLGYVAIAGTWTSADQFPEQDIQRQAQARCMPPSWAQEIRMGLVRCLPVVTSGVGSREGGMPTCDEWTTAAIENMWDSVVLRKAMCCFRTTMLNYPGGFFEGMSVVIDRQIQGPPLGGCVERYTSAQVQFPNCDCI
jgi:hypothetical protein